MENAVHYQAIHTTGEKKYHNLVYTLMGPELRLMQQEKDLGDRVGCSVKISTD